MLLALVVYQVLSVPAPPSQPDPETVEAIKRAIERRQLATGPGAPSTPGAPAEGDLETDETFLLGLWGGWGYPWGLGYGGYGLGLGSWGYGYGYGGLYSGLYGGWGYPWG